MKTLENIVYYLIDLYIGFQQKSSRICNILNTTSLYLIPVVNVASMSSARESDCTGSSFTGTDFDTGFDDKNTVSYFSSLCLSGRPMCL
jgi:hypothetical protein